MQSITENTSRKTRRLPSKHGKNPVFQIAIILLALIYFHLPCLGQNEFPVDDSEFMNAVERYRKKIREDQKNLKLHRKMVKYAQKTGRLNVPFYIYKKSHKEHPNHPVVLYALGYTYLIDGRKDSLKLAEKYLSKAVDKNPKMADAYVALGTCYLRQDKIQEGGEKIKEGIRLNPRLVPGYTSLGEYYRTKGKYDKAIKSYNFALKFNPESFEAYLGFGITYFNAKDYDKAVNKLKLALTLNKSSIEAHRFLGKTYALSGKPELAMNEYAWIAKENELAARFTWYEIANLFLDADNDQYTLKALQKVLPEVNDLSSMTVDEVPDILEDILAKRPDDTELQHFLSRLYLKTGNSESAKRHLEEIKKTKPENTKTRVELGKIYEEENKPEKAAKEYQEAAELGSTDTSVLEKIANKYFENDNIEKFIETAEKILAANPKIADIHYKLSIVYERKHDKLKDENGEPDEITKLYDLAVKHCKKAVKLATANPDYHLRLADLYAKEGKLKALREYEDVIELAPKNAKGYYHRGRFMTNFKFGGGYLLWGPEDIFNDLQKAIELNPKLAGAHSTLGKIYDRMGETKKAIKAYKKAVRLDPSIVEAQLYLAKKYADNAPQKAITAFKRSIDAGVEDAEVLKDYASLILRYDEKRKWKKAQMALEKALKKMPNDPEALMNYGYTLYLEGKHPEAIEYYKKALKPRPNNLKTLYNLAVAYEHAGQQKDALTIWKKVFRLDPNGRYSHTASERIKILNEKVEK